MHTFHEALDDTALIHRLENVAGVTNEDVLSDWEIFRGRALLSSERERLHARDSDTAFLDVEEHIRLIQRISRLSVAVSPVKRLPSEIVQRIFISTLPSEQNSQIKIPPILSEPPWLLGRICSAWRRLSRCMPELWCTVKLNYAIPDVMEILPEVTKVSFDIIDPSDVIPYLDRAHTVIWKLPLYLPFDDAFPVAMFSRICSLTMTFRSWGSWKTEMIKQIVFGCSPSLEALTLHTCTLDLLVGFDFPWHQLTRLTLIVDNGYYGRREDFYARWNELGCSSLFKNMSRLRSLGLNLPHTLSPIIPSLNIPWSELTHFGAHVPTDDVPLIMGIVQKCTSLCHLHLEADVVQTEEQKYDFAVHSPPSLIIGRNILSGLMNLAKFWENVRVLDIKATLTLEAYQKIMTCCRHIESIICSIVKTFLPSPGIAVVSLPHLHSLDLTVSDTNVFLHLDTPALTILHVKSNDGLDFLIISEYIRRSQCELADFSYTCDKWQHEPNGLRKLLSSLSTCYSFCMCRVVISENLLDDIASGCLLPYLNRATISTDTTSAYFSMLEQRLEMEVRLGRVMLHEIKGFFKYFGDFNLAERLKMLVKQHHVACSFDVDPKIDDDFDDYTECSRDFDHWGYDSDE